VRIVFLPFGFLEKIAGITKNGGAGEKITRPKLNYQVKIP